ncbi:ABC transporter substrate-binding protein [Clostridium aminobutyricum]|uniref:ABC transporter substrate-binding protein n=1 Tax=Clostridium aminobutyricum TaxID=33953 RepID=A0A939D616_CLOAM|nr:ABC transporter substrate-binding protein [Clostridium aminobutyricum]MBN7771827.1 ABC transporter substrate-binding protein [Clostridium aminobutyricum]
MKKRLISIGLVAALLLSMTACGNKKTEEENASKSELKDVTVILDYVPNTNHTGLYAAKDLGYYEDAGLNVTIIEPTDGVTATLVAAGKGDFGISYQEDVTYALASKDPLPIKAIATIIQHNTSGFASIASKHIQTPKAFENKVYAGWGAPSEEAVIHAVMNAAGADFSKLTMVTADGADYSTLDNKIDLMWMFWAWDGIAATRQGLDLNYIELRSLDKRLDYYTPVIIANTDTIENDPELVQAFMDATTKGYEYAIDNPAASAEILHKYADTYDLEMLKESQEYLAKKYSEDSEVWGLMKDSVWDGYTDFMVENGLIDKSIPAAECYTNEFIKKK